MEPKSQIEGIGQKILDRQPNAIVRHRILRDVLRLPRNSTTLASRAALLAHPWVDELTREQHADGSWGRFHSMDSTIKARFPTSEAAIRRALALGLEKGDPVLTRAVEYMVAVLDGRRVWSDRVEKSEGWPIGIEAITAGTLAQIDPAHPSIEQAWVYWAEIARLSLPSGEYVPQAEWNAHRDLRGIGIQYLRSRYVLTLLGARSRDLPAALDRQLVDWIWNTPEGIGYLGADLQHPDPYHIFHWLESLEILSHFQCWRDVTSDALDRLWNQRNTDGLWDFGTKVSKSYYFPLSDNWRMAGTRQLDHSTIVLALLQSYDPGY
jgi:hypothetical protein